MGDIDAALLFLMERGKVVLSVFGPDEEAAEYDEQDRYWAYLLPVGVAMAGPNFIGHGKTPADAILRVAEHYGFKGEPKP